MVHELARTPAGTVEDASVIEPLLWLEALCAAVERLAGTLHEGDGYAGAFQRAIEASAAASDRFAEARAQLGLGRRLRRDGHRVRARQHLTLALERFEALRAAPWAQQARTELGASAPNRATGGSADRDALTAQERRVAELVAEGASNKDAAAMLFLSPKTIETHLGRAYRKLGITSRSQLAGALLGDRP